MTKSTVSNANIPIDTSFGRINRLILVVFITVMVSALSAWVYLPHSVFWVAVLSALCLALWATGIVPEYWPAFLFFLVAMLLELAPAESVFSGFHSPPYWLLFSGLILGISMNHTGLGNRLAALLSRTAGSTYSGVIIRIVFFGLALAFVVPSSIGRVVLLLAIVKSLAEHMGYKAGSNGQTGMMIAATLGTCLPAFTILPANGPNMVLAGMAESLYGIQLSYWDYLILHFPVLGLLKAGILVLLILRVLPSEDPAARRSELSVSGSMTVYEKQLSVVLGLCLLLWLTDRIHHISPGWIGLAAAVYCLVPFTGLTQKNCLNTEVKYGPLFFVGGIMGLGVVISQSGLGQAIVEPLSEHLPFTADKSMWNLVSITGISMLVAAVTNLPGVPAIMSPLAESLSEATGFSITTILMSQVLAFSNVLLLYQVPPVVAAIQIGNLPTWTVTKLCLVMFVIGLVVLMPLDLLWWQILGMFDG